MENINIEKTKKTPFVSFNYITGRMIINGVSIPENSAGFYEPLLDWMRAYVQNPAEHTVVDVTLNYYNTSSSKWLLDIFSILNTMYKKEDKQVLVNWYYSDEDIFDTGEDYKTILELPFHLIEI